MSIGIQMESGEFLTLNQNQTIKFALKSTLFNERIEANSRSFTFKAPAEPNNLLLNYSNELQARSRVISFKVKVYLLGLFWKNALLEITDFNEVEYTFRLLIDRGFNAIDSSKSLRDFKYENGSKKQLRFVNEQLPNIVYAFDDTDLTGPTTITFDFFLTYATGPGNNIVVQFDYDPSAETIARFVSRIVEWFNERVYEYHYFFVQLPSPFTNQFEILNLTSNTGTGFFFTLTSSDPDLEIINVSGGFGRSVNITTAYQRMVRDAIDNNRDYICVPVLAPGLFSETNPNYWGYQNLIQPETQTIPALGGQLVTSDQPVCPFPFLKPMLYSIIKELGNVIVRDDFFDDELSNLLLYNHEAINNANRMVKKGWRYRFTAAFYYSDIVPDIALNTFLNDLRLYFNLLIDYNSRGNTVKIIRVENLMREQAEDWSEYLVKEWNYRNEPLEVGLAYTWFDEPLSTELLPAFEQTQVGENVNFKINLPPTPVNGFRIQKAVKENKYYRFDTAWQLFAEDFYPVNPDAPRKMQTGASPLFTAEDDYVRPTPTMFFDIKWLLPYTKQPGNTSEFDDVQAPHRYLIYRGLRAAFIKPSIDFENYLSATYPFASSHNYDLNGSKIGNYSLAWNAEDGVYEKLWKRWIEYLKKSSPVMMEFKLPIDILLNIDITRKKLVNGVEYFIDELDFEVNVELSTIKCKMYPIKTQ